MNYNYKTNNAIAAAFALAMLLLGSLLGAGGFMLDRYRTARQAAAVAEMQAVLAKQLADLSRYDVFGRS